MNNQNRRKILQIVKGIDIGGNSGGAESFGIRLARSLHEHQWDVYVCAFFKYDTPVEEFWFQQLEKSGVIVFFACKNSKNQLIGASKVIQSFIREYHIDIIHSHYQVGTIVSIFLKYTHLYHYLIRTAHIYSEFGSTILGKLSRLVFRELVYPILVDREIGVSQAITQRLNRQLLRSILHKPANWIPNAIPDNTGTRLNGDRPGYDYEQISDQDWIVTTVGILVSRKKIDILIRAMVKVIKAIPNAKLVIVGGGPENKNLADLAYHLGISSACIFLGQQQDVHSILRKTDLFVLPSSSEGISTVILEAIQNMVPVIASDIPGNRELIANNQSGWLVPVGDVDKLADTIVNASDYPDEAKRMAETAYHQIKNYSMDEVCKKYIEIYSSLPSIS